MSFFAELARSADVVIADGQRLRAGSDQNPEQVRLARLRAAGARCPSAGSCEAMSLRSHVSLPVRPSRTPWRSTATWITLVLSACSPVASASATPSQPALGLPASSSGVCQAIVALPDLSASERAFTNLAHEALHGLAADPRLDRAMSARVLEAMEKVETDFNQSTDVPELVDDLAELHASA